MKIRPKWQEWKGGECPVNKSRPVTVVQRNGDVFVGYGLSFIWRWNHDSYTPYDIIAYCPLDIEPYKPKPKWTVRQDRYTDCFYVAYKGKVVTIPFESESAATAIADALNAAGGEL